MNPGDLRSTDTASVQFASKDQVGTSLRRNDDLAVFHLRGVDLRSDAELLTHIARAMSFPDYFGQNYDALNDCLPDLDWCPAPGYVLIVWDADMATPTVLNNLRHCWEFCAPYWTVPAQHDEFCPQQPTPFHLVFVGEDEHIFPLSKGSA